MSTQTQKRRLALYHMTTTALFAAVMCLLCPWSIPIGIIPVSLGTFAVLITAGTIGSKRGTVAVLIYLLLGMAGLPVFSGMRGGAGVLLGPTGGYLIGYLLTAFVVGLAKNKKIWWFPILSVLGVALCYLCGTLWYMVSAGRTFLGALKLCVIPFLPYDAAKIVLATLLFPALSGVESKVSRRA
jgi:biotin transport system substrate-specific component